MNQVEGIDKKALFKQIKSHHEIEDLRERLKKKMQK